MKIRSYIDVKLEAKRAEDAYTEMDYRDDDLANIFNTTETKSDLYMKIIDYLVKKWFLQELEPQQNEVQEYPSEDNLVEKLEQLIERTKKIWSPISAWYMVREIKKVLSSK